MTNIANYAGKYFGTMPLLMLRLNYWRMAAMGNDPDFDYRNSHAESCQRNFAFRTICSGHP
jgi:hypothetical protein